MDEEALVVALKKGPVSILAKPNAKKTDVIGFDAKRGVFVISIAEAPEDNAANIELIKFLSKIAKNPVRIKSGLTNKRKVVMFA